MPKSKTSFNHGLTTQPHTATALHGNAHAVSEQQAMERERASVLRSLWLAVLKQAIDDLRLPEWDIHYQSAVSYLTGNSRDLREVCSLAGVNVDRLRAAVRKRMEVPHG